MPTIDLNLIDLEKLMKKKLPQSRDELAELFMYVKGEIDAEEGKEIKLDVKETNRPDLWSSEGIARELKAKLGMERGLPKYKVKKGNIKVFIDKNLENVRPFIACAAIKGIKVNEDLLIQLIQLQEKVAHTFGRKRKEVGVGLYDLDKMKPPVYYKGFKDKEISFIPLEFKVELSPREILLEHPKGKLYGNLLHGKEFYPIVIDKNKTVASMPPIINSETTGKVNEKTKNLFLECTGSNWEMVNIALNVMCMALADRGGKIESCKINFPKGKIYPKKALYTPSFGVKKIQVSIEKIHSMFGIKLSNKEIIDLLEKSRYEAKIKKNKVEAVYPDFRNDILHEVDVIEDMLIAYGYNNLNPITIKISTTGSEINESKNLDSAREACIGLGLQEVLQYTLTSKEKQVNKMNLNEETEEFVELANPMTASYAIFRKSLIPELLEFFYKNRNELIPQRIFEAGKIFELNEKKDNKVNEKNALAAALLKNESSFTEIKSHLTAFAKNYGIEFELENLNHPSFIEGRCAKIKTSTGKEGIIGEIHPQVLFNFGLQNPVVVFELEL
ncbi:MAG TPA: phenylalanine--tRNA ligase subunit beta, partial [archaeon]|nr:phenylalanine--tRNA ligase subunit beta [archaeon]